jgi:hypothetical protein
MVDRFISVRNVVHTPIMIHLLTQGSGVAIADFTLLAVCTDSLILYVESIKNETRPSKRI